MNVEIGAEAKLFPVKDYINGIFVAVRDKNAQLTVTLQHNATVMPVWPVCLSQGAQQTTTLNFGLEAKSTLGCARFA
jgi:hypothetical protein